MKALKPRDLLEVLNQRDDVYCHISTWIFKDNIFEPRIPFDLEIYNQNENDNINRVCVASTLEGALQAIPRGGEYLFDWYEDNALYFKVYIIDTLKLGIKKECIYNPEYLVKNKYVSDAEFTGEHWILETFEVPEDYTFLIKVKRWELDKENSFALKNVDIITDFISENEIIELDLEYAKEIYCGGFCLNEEKEKLKKEYLKMNPEIDFMDDDNDIKITIMAKKDQSIRKLMEFDSRYKSKAFCNSCMI